MGRDTDLLFLGPDGRTLQEIPGAHDTKIRNVGTSFGNPSRLVTLDDQVLIVRRATDGYPQGAGLTLDPDTPALASDPRGRRLATGGSEGVTIIDGPNPHVTCRLPVMLDSTRVHHLAFSSDGNTLLVIQDQDLSLWQLPPSSIPRTTPDEDVNLYLTDGPDGLLLHRIFPKRVRIEDLESGELVHDGPLPEGIQKNPSLRISVRDGLVDLSAREGRAYIPLDDQPTPGPPPVQVRHSRKDGKLWLWVDRKDGSFRLETLKPARSWELAPNHTRLLVKIRATKLHQDRWLPLFFHIKNTVLAEIGGQHTEKSPPAPYLRDWNNQIYGRQNRKGKGDGKGKGGGKKGGAKGKVGGAKMTAEAGKKGADAKGGGFSW